MRFSRMVIAPLLTVALIATASEVNAQRAAIWTVPEVSALPHDTHGQLVREGRDLINATYANIGPDVADAAKRYAGNNLACTNCHLSAGTKKFGLPLFGLYDQFPQYSSRSGATISIEDRINSCMTRSMNGRPLPLDAPEMRAIVSYIDFLSTGVPAGEKVPGLGAGKMSELHVRQIPIMAALSTRESVLIVTTPTARALAAIAAAPTSVTWCRHCGARALSTTAPEWRG
ncbi:MAG: c-type cytochrome [Xanthobacteraceae bacterium]